MTALAAMDRLRAGVACEPGLAEVDAGALVHLQSWPGGSVGDLAGVVGRSQPATVRLVDRLVGQGLLCREAGVDRRTVALVLTDAGSRAANAVLAARTAALAPLLAELSLSERAALERLLGRIAAGLAEDRPSAVHTCRLCDRNACMSGPGCPLEHTIEPGGGRRPSHSTTRP
ncbi:MAG: MarR family winged helix-turn-helix transcriptional regulator [Solirubrobacteraceae bacterium]